MTTEARNEMLRSVKNHCSCMGMAFGLCQNGTDEYVLYRAMRSGTLCHVMRGSLESIRLFLDGMAFRNDEYHMEGKYLATAYRAPDETFVSAEMQSIVAGR